MRPDGAEYGGQKLSRGALYLILQNRLYRGEIAHKGNTYPGEHPAIIDKPLWARKPRSWGSVSGAALIADRACPAKGTGR